MHILYLNCLVPIYILEEKNLSGGTILLLYLWLYAAGCVLQKLIPSFIAELKPKGCYYLLNWMDLWMSVCTCTSSSIQHPTENSDKLLAPFCTSPLLPQEPLKT